MADGGHFGFGPYRKSGPPGRQAARWFFMSRDPLTKWKWETPLTPFWKRVYRRGTGSTSNEVLQRAKLDAIEAMVMRSQLRWVDHVQRMSNNRIPKQIIHSELSLGARSRGWQRKRYKDTLKQTLKLTGINCDKWHELAENRTAWRQTVKKGARLFESGRLNAREDKRKKRKAKEALHINVQQNTSAVFVCQFCGKACKSRIGLYSHSRTHPEQQHWHHRNRQVHQQ